MTPEEKDRETAEQIVNALTLSDAYQDSDRLNNLESKAEDKLVSLIVQALHSTRISALKEAAEVLRQLSDDIKADSGKAYCDGFDFSKTPLCLGEDFKLERGEFKKANLEAHRRVAEKFGAHFALAATCRRARTLHDEIMKELEK